MGRESCSEEGGSEKQDPARGLDVDLLQHPGRDVSKTHFSLRMCFFFCDTRKLSVFEMWLQVSYISPSLKQK